MIKLAHIEALQRVPNWNLLYVEKILELRKQNQESRLVFDWDPSQNDGTHNCLTFASTMIQTITGKDLYEMLSPEDCWSTPLGAMKILRALGFNSVDQLIGSIFSEQRITYVQRGDLVMIPCIDEGGEGMNLLGVASADPPFFWCVGPEGLSKGSLNDAVKAYKVG